MKAIAAIPKNILTKSFSEMRKVNYYITGIIGLFGFFFLAISELPLSAIISFALDGCVYIFLLTTLHIYILKFCASRYHKQAKYFNFWRYSLGFIGAILIHFFIYPFFEYLSGIQSEFEFHRTLIFIAEGFIFASLTFFMHNYIILSYFRREIELENSILKMRSEEAKNLLLKKQIHPHFFFNSLNTLKAIYKKDVGLGETYLIHLANFMRLAVSNHYSEASTLKEEIEVCENYLMMQKIRFGESLQWNKTIENPEKLNWFLPFFSLQPLVENAIKHNSFTKEKPFHIHIIQQGDQLRVENRLQPKTFKEPSSKSGLVNLNERYNIWCKEEITIRQTEDIFFVEFKLFPHENPNY